jgi:hypothetical protein
MKKVVRLTESDFTKIVKRVIKENEEEGMVVNKVENFVEKPKVQNYINNMISKLSDEEIQELENSLEDLGIDGNSSAEEIHDIVVNNSESQNTEMTEENENPKDKVAEILHRIGAGNIAAWGGVPAAIAIGSATGIPMGFAISWGVTGLLMGIAHLLNNKKKVTESDLTNTVKKVIKENEFEEDESEMDMGPDCDEIITEMEYIFNDFIRYYKNSSPDTKSILGASAMYDELESELGGLLDMAEQNDCENRYDIESTYEELLDMFRSQVGLGDEEYDEDDMGDSPKEKKFGDGNENEMYLTNNVRFYRKGGELILSYTPTKITGGIKISDKQKQMLIDFLSK